MKLRAIINLVWLAPVALLLAHAGSATASPAAVAASQSFGALAANSSAEAMPTVISSRFSQLNTIHASPQLVLASNRHGPDHPFAAESTPFNLSIPLSSKKRSHQPHHSTSHSNHSGHSDYSYSDSKAKPARKATLIHKGVKVEH